MKIIGIDPGSRLTGYGIIERRGNSFSHLTHGVVKTEGAKEFAQRLYQIFKELSHVCAEFKPEIAAVEKTFFAKNALSAMKLGQARGAALTALAGSGISVIEISPNEVKKTLVGHGHGNKDQVNQMVKLHLNLQSIKSHDASDALAIAITGSLIHRFEQKREVPCSPT